MSSELKRFIYRDGEKTKSILGWVISEDEHCFKILAFRDRDEVILGKGSIIKVEKVAAQ